MDDRMTKSNRSLIRVLKGKNGKKWKKAILKDKKGKTFKKWRKTNLRDRNTINPGSVKGPHQDTFCHKAVENKRDLKIRQTNYQQITVIWTNCNTESRSHWNVTFKGLRKIPLAGKCMSNKTIIQKWMQNKAIFR